MSDVLYILGIWICFMVIYHSFKYDLKKSIIKELEKQNDK